MSIRKYLRKPSYRFSRNVVRKLRTFKKNKITVISEAKIEFHNFIIHHE